MSNADDILPPSFIKDEISEKLIIELLQDEYLYFQDDCDQPAKGARAHNRLQSYTHLLNAEAGDAASSYRVIDQAIAGLDHLISLEIMNQEFANASDTEMEDMYPIHLPLEKLQLDALKYLGRCLINIQNGEDPKEALNLNPGRRGGGRPTLKKQKAAFYQRVKEQVFAAAVKAEYQRIGNLDEACEIIANKNQMENRESTVKGWYGKHIEFTTDAFVNEIETLHPDLTGLMPINTEDE